MQGIYGQSFCEIKIDGNLLDPSKVRFEFAAIRSHVIFYLPTLELSLVDYSTYLNQFNITDATIITIRIGSSEVNSTEWTDFKVFSCTPGTAQEGANIGSRFNIVAFYNFSEYIYKRENKTYNNIPSSNVFSEIITLSKDLTSVIDTTKDTKIWRNSSKTLAEFFKKDVLPYSYVNDESYMLAGISAHSKKAFFRNVSNVSKSEPKFKLINTSEVPRGVYDYLIDEYEYINDSGLFNKIAYGLKTLTYDITSALSSTASEVKVTKVDKKLNIKPESQVQAQRVFSPLELGNTDPKHHESLTRNTRNASTFSIKLDVLIRSITNIDMFDLVNVSIVKQYENVDLDERISGNYICIGKAMLVTNSEYVERIALTRNGENLTESTLI